MRHRHSSTLNPKQHYLQIALNSTLDDAKKIISRLPISNRIILEAGTPLIKRYGVAGLRQLKSWYLQHTTGKLSGTSFDQTSSLISILSSLVSSGQSGVGEQFISSSDLNSSSAYLVADMKMMDRGATEVDIAADGGANAVVALGKAPIESLNQFISRCQETGLDSMIDMMNVDQPHKILRQLKNLPTVVILHRGVDEEQYSNKPFPIHLINKVKGTYDLMVSIAGGDTSREVQSAIFNGANIVVLWKNFYKASSNTSQIAQDFLQQIK